MATERLSTYKRSGKTLFSIKFTNKISVIERQSRSRDDLITRKRMKLNITLEDDGDDLCKKTRGSDSEQVLNAIKCLKKGDKLKSLTDLHRLFACCEDSAEKFLKSDGLQSLHSCFRSYDVEILHASAWAVINLTAASSSSPVLLGLAPTLMQFLRGSDGVMQELCAWGLANMAGDDPSNAHVLHKQGCTEALIDLLEFSHLDNEERTRSILFALINMARSNSVCVQCMHDRYIYGKLHLVLERTPVDSALNFEIGWLLCSIYPGCDEMTFQTDHITNATRLVSERLTFISEGLVSSYKVCFPYVRCLCNLISQDPSMAKVMLNDPRASKVISDLLTSSPENLRLEILVLISNCIVDVCTRVLLILQPKLLSAIISQCHRNAADLTIQALLVMKAMARISAYIDKYLLESGILSTLTAILSISADQLTTGSCISLVELLSSEAALPLKISIDILLDLGLSQPELMKRMLDKTKPEQKSMTLILLTRLVSSDIQLVDTDLVHQASQLVHLLNPS